MSLYCISGNRRYNNTPHPSQLHISCDEKWSKEHWNLNVLVLLDHYFSTCPPTSGLIPDSDRQLLYKLMFPCSVAEGVLTKGPDGPLGKGVYEDILPDVDAHLLCLDVAD